MTAREKQNKDPPNRLIAVFENIFIFLTGEMIGIFQFVRMDYLEE